jgi:hypothetical protein
MESAIERVSLSQYLRLSLHSNKRTVLTVAANHAGPVAQ